MECSTSTILFIFLLTLQIGKSQSLQCKPPYYDKEAVPLTSGYYLTCEVNYTGGPPFQQKCAAEYPKDLNVCWYRYGNKQRLNITWQTKETSFLPKETEGSCESYVKGFYFKVHMEGEDVSIHHQIDVKLHKDRRSLNVKNETTNGYVALTYLGYDIYGDEQSQIIETELHSIPIAPSSLTDQGLRSTITIPSHPDRKSDIPWTQAEKAHRCQDMLSTLPTIARTVKSKDKAEDLSVNLPHEHMEKEEIVRQNTGSEDFSVDKKTLVKQSWLIPVLATGIAVLLFMLLVTLVLMIVLIKPRGKCSSPKNKRAKVLLICNMKDNTTMERSHRLVSYLQSNFSQEFRYNWGQTVPIGKGAMEWYHEYLNWADVVIVIILEERTSRQDFIYEDFDGQDEFSIVKNHFLKNWKSIKKECVFLLDEQTKTILSEDKLEEFKAFTFKEEYKPNDDFHKYLRKHVHGNEVLRELENRSMRNHNNVNDEFVFLMSESAEDIVLYEENVVEPNSISINVNEWGNYDSFEIAKRYHRM